MQYVRWKKCITITIIVLCIVQTLLGQDQVQRSIIRGKILDKITKQPLAGANVWLIKSKLGTVADEAGYYTIESVPIGRHSLRISLVGYRTEMREDIPVVSGRAAVVNIELELNLIEMENVEVQAEYFESDVDKSLVSILSIKREEVSKTPGPPDLFRRLQSVAGVVRASDQSPMLVVRGGSADENLTLIDNMEVFSPYHFASFGGGMENGLSIIDPKLIEDVTFSSGGFSVKYGDRLSSVSEITLREPDKKHITGDAYLNVSGIGSFFTGPLTENSSWMISGRRGFYDLIMKLRGEDYRPRTIDLHSKILYEPSPEHSFSITGIYVQDEVTGLRKEEKNLTGVQKNMKITKDVLSLGLNWRWLYSKNGFLLITPYVNLNSWDEHKGPEENPDYFTTGTKENIMGIRAEAVYQLSREHQITFGGDVKSVEATYDKRAGADTLFTGVSIPAYSISFGPSYASKVAVFAEYTVFPFPWLRTSAGVRYDYFDYIQRGVVSPRFAMSAEINEQIRMYGAIGMFTQFLSFYKIFLHPANTRLAPSKAIHYIAGTEYLVYPDLQLKVEGFYKGMRDLTTASTDTSKILVSSGSGHSYGIEFTVTQRMSNNLFILVNYTNSKSRRSDISAPSEYDFDFDSPHMFNLMANYRIGDWWEIGLIYRYATGLPYTPYELSTRRIVGGRWFCDKDAKNSARLPDYQRLDIRIDHRFIYNSWNLDLFIEVWNLTGHENVVRYDYNEDFTEEVPFVLFRLMPMIGIAVEF
jgi:outer membrane receptor protein involved in Fe transport